MRLLIDNKIYYVVQLYSIKRLFTNIVYNITLVYIVTNWVDKLTYTNEETYKIMIKAR